MGCLRCFFLPFLPPLVVDCRGLGADWELDLEDWDAVAWESVRLLDSDTVEDRWVMVRAAFGALVGDSSVSDWSQWSRWERFLSFCLRMLSD